ncbi:MAG: DinB family protein [Vicinamibacteria bacterium]
MSTDNQPSAMFVDIALRNWKQNVERAAKFFNGCSDEDLQLEVAPGKNRLIYLFGHIIAVNDGLLPLLGFGPRLHPEWEETFVKSPDRAVAALPSAAELRQAWTAVHSRLAEKAAALTPDEWLRKHAAVSTEDFAKEPHRNRVNVLFSRTTHLASHLGQAVLAPKRTAQ